ncbi:MAG: tRNA (N6-isopentenyl adenosine(37)-C2)-methylthiotransferase MiaB [Deltaproteobacteria bacterium]|nr:tRNA (N6-isopentenyl adenosine(37)-C2)-methylthiotransferase MiaB [Deltaproteobacteria bacterium]
MTDSAGQGASKACKNHVYLETNGCQMNYNDSSRIMGLLKNSGYVRTGEPDKAGLILINTCSIRDKAEQKVYSAAGRFKKLKGSNPRLIIGVCGCVAEQEGARLLKRAPYIDIVLGTQNIHRLREVIAEVRAKKRAVLATGLKGFIEEGEYSVHQEAVGVKAFVSIMRGCNNFCSYCIVPYTRGPEVSRDSGGIIREIESLASAGVREVTLLGQNVNSYGSRAKGALSFPDLIRLVARVHGVERIRFMTSHPKDTTGELIGLFNEEKKLCRHFHLPVQSGSDTVLKAMGRGYTREEYLEKVFTLKGLYPDMAITTDIIVGFPGETEKDFEDTMRLIRAVRFDNIFSFMYSPRPNTRASAMDNRIAPEVKSGRLKILQDEQRAVTFEKSREKVGSTQKVLVEGPSKADVSELTGRTNCLRVVNFPVPRGKALKLGHIEDVLITEAYPNSLRGALKQGGAVCSWK